MTDDARPRAADPERADTLPCGTDSASLLTQVCEGRGSELTEHQAACPHCQAELRRCRELWSPVDGLAREPVRAPQAVVARALAWVREMAGDQPQAARFRMADLPDGRTGPAGESWIAARVVIRSARLAAEQVDGVRVALGHLVAAPSATSSAAPPQVGSPAPDGSQDERTVLEVAIAADYGQDLYALAERIRVRVVDEVRQLTGRAPTAVDVLVDDVLA
ncbi:putative alkaline shock family protein YloU [Actinomycetospora succinea]|uniref:Putative alkaline shock family protein YloU n=1 Tax=Actinomycetospora succinea TaxID=663603 RepID=A0A4V3D743_9PSEU|nr:Asp23/Gls24 family envelope stress response protein [Actinomycetospora succinea]TDQ46377.1 putative alkaline shock family protein YloU [Actinomycetospora succinea]